MSKVLVVGSGGREHALAWALQRSVGVDEVHVAPGNGGTASLATNVAISADDVDGLAAYAESERFDLTVVGPEVPLSLGVADAFVARGLRVFGPSAQAARIESSKAFSKDFMRAHGIPTADYGLFDDYDQAVSYVEAQSVPIVVKASGLAAGKGAFVCRSDQEALAALDIIMKERAFGPAGDIVVIEAFVMGQEVSVLAFCDGETIAPMILSQDHKPVFDGDRGPNTGGMGCYAPASVLGPDLLARVQDEVLQATVDGMAAAGTPYVGVLYAGLMVSDDEFSVLEFNCRFGDPETQAILPLLHTDLHAVLDACIEGDLDQIELTWDDAHCVCVVMASEGYPGAYDKGHRIEGLGEVADRDDTMVFHAGTRRKGDHVYTDGGRVLGVTSWAPTLENAVTRAYSAVDEIAWPGAFCRRDIGAKGLVAAKGDRR